MNSPTQVIVAPKGMGLNDFVAQQDRFFAAEGLEVSFDWKTLRGTQSSWKDLTYFERPRDRPYAEGRDVIQGACAWGSICNASAGMGRFVPQAYGNSPWAIFVRSDSRFRTPQDLKDVPIAVGMRAGSHFNVPYRLEKYLPLANIKVVNTGGFGARLKALLEGEVEAASLLPPQIAMAEQLGLRKIIADRFHTLWGFRSRPRPKPSVRICVPSIARKKRWTLISRNICPSGSSLCHRNSRTASGTTAASAAASASFTSPLRAASSTK